MYQYRNLPPRHQPPGFYPPHQPSLRSQYQRQLNQQRQQQHHHHSHHSHHHHHPHSPHSPNPSLNTHSLTRSASHGAIHYSPKRERVSSSTNPASPTTPTETNSGGQYRTHHIVSPQRSEYGAAAPGAPTATASAVAAAAAAAAAAANGPDAIYAMQQLQRIKAATACQIINNRVVEAIREQQKKKWAQKQLKKKLCPGWKDPNETNPNNPAYKGPENAKLVKLLSKKQKALKKLIKATKIEKDPLLILPQHPESPKISPPSDSPPNEHELSVDAVDAAKTLIDLNDDESDEIELDPEKELELEQQVAFAELEELERNAMTIPQLEISTAPRSTANITNLTEDELKMNPELYQMYSYYAPFANQVSLPHPHDTPPRHSKHNLSHLRSQSLPPQYTSSPHSQITNQSHHSHLASPPHSKHAPYSFRTNMGPRRLNPNFLKPQLNKTDDPTKDANINNNIDIINKTKTKVNDNNQLQMPHTIDTSINDVFPASVPFAQPLSAASVVEQNLFSDQLSQINEIQHLPQKQTAKLVPIGPDTGNPLDSPVKSKSAKKNRSHSIKNGLQVPHIAPAHANVQSVISPNGGIYHPCHGYSTREISIFDLFPAIVKYQSKKFSESDRVDYLLSLSEKPFAGVNNRPLNVDEAEMWYTALKYLFNDITLGQFDYMTMEMRYVIKQYMNSHRNRSSFLNSIKQYGFLRVISDISKKLPREHIQKIMKQEQAKKEKQRLLILAANEKLKQEHHRKLMIQQQQLLLQQQQQQLYQQQYFATHGHPPPTPLHAGYPTLGPLQPPIPQQPPQHLVPGQHPQPMMIHNGHIAPAQQHYNDWYIGNKLKRTTSEPTPIHTNNHHHLKKGAKHDMIRKSEMPAIIDDDNDDGIGIDDSWDFITEIVNENKIPDLPPEKKPICNKQLTPQKDDMELLKLPELPPGTRAKKLLFDTPEFDQDYNSKSKNTKGSQEGSARHRDDDGDDQNDDDKKQDITLNEEETLKQEALSKQLEKEIAKKEKETANDLEKEEMDEIVEVYNMMYQTMKDKNGNNDDDDESEDEHDDEIALKEKHVMNVEEVIDNDIIGQDEHSKSTTERIKSFTITPEQESPQLKMDTDDTVDDDHEVRHHDDDDVKHDDVEMDINVVIDHDNDIGDIGPNISFADLSGFTNNNKPKTDDSFIPKLPFNVNWNNNNSLSIWVDNPYAKPSKYFKTNKKHSKYKRGKSQRK